MKQKTRIHESKTIKLIDALRNVNKSAKNISSTGCLWNYFEYFNGNYYGNTNDEKFEQRVKCYWIFGHICADTFVGMEAIYMDDILIGFWNRNGRKENKTAHFLSTAVLKQFIEFIYECVEKEEDQYFSLIINEEDLEEEITRDDWIENI